MPTPIDPRKRYGHLLNAVNWAVCDKCGWSWPEGLLNYREGKKVCPNHSTYRETKNMRDTKFEKAAARLSRRKEPVPKWPHTPEMRDISGVFKLTPSKLSLVRGGASKTMELAGRNLSAADAFTFSNANLTLSAATTYTAIDPDTKGNKATLTIQAGGATPFGRHNLLVNGDVFPQCIEVTS
jgi:hypothetical protein